MARFSSSVRAVGRVGAPDEMNNLPWSPPDFADQKQARIGASVVEQFVSGHNAGDVLRELVQNEFDGGGDQLNVKFGENALEVVGNGRGITTDGWQRLSVIVGTGRVVGAAEGERVDARPMASVPRTLDCALCFFLATRSMCDPEGRSPYSI